MTRVFVFGSNLSGIHGAGAAKHAREAHGAEWGVGEGRTGRSYALPTKEADVRTPRSLDDVRESVGRFVRHARENPGDEFLLTPVGCGLAGFRRSVIGPMFHRAGLPPNVVLATSWLEPDP